jgi:hypothetical protein
MARDTKRKGGGGKLARSETVTVRLDPKLRYMAELSARKQRRTLSSYIEWAIEDSLNRAVLDMSRQGPSVAEEIESLWDVDEADRYAKLALRHPELLTHEEQILWKLIRENGYLWRGRYASSDNEWTWTVKEESLIFERLREHWTSFCSVAETGNGQELLPSWRAKDPNATKQNSSTKKSIDELDDDIPF